jgi:hypothetical protein
MGRGAAGGIPARVVSVETPQEPGAGDAFGRVFDGLVVLIGGLLAVLGGMVTLIVGFLLGAYLFERIGGGRPSPGLAHSFIPWLILGAGPLFFGELLLQRGGLTRRHWLWRVLLGVLLLFVVLGADALCGPKNWHAPFRRERMLVADAQGMKATCVSPHLEAEIAKGTNLIWCGTFQLCWNEACDLTGGDLRLTNALRHFGLRPPSPDDPMVTALNEHAFTKESIDEASYVALADFVTNAIHDRIERAIKEKFHGSFKPRFVPDRRLTPRPQDFVAYACLYKNLSFPVPFERLEDEFRFENVPVRAFGIGSTKVAHDNMYPQMRILDYRGTDDFVIELKTRSEDDRLILAKVQPQRKLGETVAAVRERVVRGKPEPTLTNDVLIVPRMNFELTRRYTEIEGRLLVPRSASVAKDLFLLSAVQNTRFEMNEKGVELRSEAHMAFGCAKEAPPARSHRMIFDKPFLLLMERTGAKMPYFALWVDNSELLVPW